MHPPETLTKRNIPEFSGIDRGSEEAEEARLKSKTH